MSIVRMSEKLVGSVVENVCAIYNRRVEEVNKRKPDVGDALYDIIYEPYINTMRMLPECFFRKHYEFDVRRVDGVEMAIKFKLSVHRIGSYGLPDSEHINKDDYHDRIFINRTHRTEEIVDAILAWKRELDAVYERRNASNTELKRLMRRHKSLPPAVKDFPPLAELLHPETKNKTSVPQHRLSSVTMELNPALKQLAADIAVDKFLRS